MIVITREFTKNLPKNFWEQESKDMQIFVDTREQKPLKFDNSVKNKLDFGDYTAAGEYYSKTFVDRKAQDDFRQTFGKDIERFRREMDRCVQFNSYMFIVVESSVEKIEEDNKISKFKSNLGYLWHNVRSLMIDYPENIQFVFAYSRAGAKKIIPKILYHGQDLWHVDIQYHLEKKDNKIFILESKDSDELICTYNIDPGNLSMTTVLPNTILVHRKKESNSLYTINALNELIKSLNEGIVDINYRINWQHYKNTILLTQQGDLKLLRTKIFQIVEL